MMFASLQLKIYPRFCKIERQSKRKREGVGDRQILLTYCQVLFQSTHILLLNTCLIVNLISYKIEIFQTTKPSMTLLRNTKINTTKRATKCSQTTETREPQRSIILQNAIFPAVTFFFSIRGLIFLRLRSPNQVSMVLKHMEYSNFLNCGCYIFADGMPTEKTMEKWRSTVSY